VKKYRGPKLLSELIFNQKVESRVHKINNAIEALYNEVSQLTLLAEDQMTAEDREVLPPDAGRMYNCASDIKEWAEAIEETIDGINTGSVLLKLRKMNAKKHKKRTKNVA
jgi:hypothetical protein